MSDRLMTALKVTAGVTAAVAVGTAYVLVHEHRRKLKKEKRVATAAAGGSADGSTPSVLAVDKLIELLAESANAAYQLIEQVRACPSRVWLRLVEHGSERLRSAQSCCCSSGSWLLNCCASAEAPAARSSALAQTRKMVHEKHVQTGASLENCVDELQKDFEAAMETVMGSIRAKHGVTEQAMSAAMVQHQSNPTVAAAVTALREAMGGKAPPGYGQASPSSETEAAKQRRRKKAGKRTG